MNLKDKLKHFAIGSFIPGSITYNCIKGSLAERKNALAKGESPEGWYEIVNFNIMNALCDFGSYTAGYGIVLLEPPKQDVSSALLWAGIVGVGYRGIFNTFVRSELERERSESITLEHVQA